MKKILLLTAIFAAGLEMEAQAQFYVAKKAGGGATGNADSTRYANLQIGRVMGLDDLEKIVAELEAEVAYLRNRAENCNSADTLGGGGAEEVSYEYVDLGLPSGTLWATCNIGATKPEGYGDYFPWAETTPKDTLSDEKGKWYSLARYEMEAMGIINRNEIVVPQYDAANAILGAEWRMPTFDEAYELSKLESEWTTMNGVSGRLIKGLNGNTLFLPAAGKCSGNSLRGSGETGYYWASTIEHKESAKTYMGCAEKNLYASSVTGKYDDSYPIRPVYAAKNIWTRDTVTYDELWEAIGEDALVDMGSNVLWSRSNVGATGVITDSGERYAWGETEPKETYTKANYLWNGTTIEELRSEGVVDEDGNLTLEYDAATILLGGHEYNLPTSKEVAELYENSVSTWIVVKMLLDVETMDWEYKEGRLVKSLINGNMIFFPAGYYWTATGSDNYADQIDVYDGCWSNTFIKHSSCSSDNLRYMGQLIRPVMRLK